MVLGCCVRIPHIRRYNSGRSFLPRPKKRGFGQLLILGPRLSSVRVPVTAIAMEERVLGVRRALRQPAASAFGFEPEMLPKISYRLRCATAACRNRSQREILDMSLSL